MSVPGRRPSAGGSERDPLLRRRRSYEHGLEHPTPDEADTLAGGTILGIHNLAIVFPQFVVRIRGTFTPRH